MAYFRIEYYSHALRRQAAFEMLIPNDPREPRPARPMSTLFLLHGYTGKAENWVPWELPEKHNFAIVMPSCENGFYLDGISTGHAFQTMVGVELVDYVRKTFNLARTPADTFIAGLSMGGYGALHTALAYPDTFGKAAGLSSALIVHDIAHMPPGSGNEVANYEYYRECFGDLETVEERDTNPETLVRKLKAAGKPLPELFIACGTEDFLIENNRAFHRFLADEGVAHEYREGKGQHDMVFWHEYIAQAVAWMFA